MALSMECDTCAARGASSWSLREVSWRRVLRQQDYGSWASTAVVGIALLVTQAILDGPRDRPFMVTDATISFPYRGDSTVPYWLAVVVAVAALVFSVLLAELVLARKLHANASDAVAAVVHFLIDGISAFIVTGLATTVTKMLVGRFRPDFLSRCQPAIPDPVAVKYGLPAADNPACTAEASGELTDGHYSFPSGHTSTVFVFAVWTAAYCIWAFNMRLPTLPNSRACCSLGQRVMRDVGVATGFIWIVALLGYAWGVSVSRITDFKHHPSDVAAGALLGSVFGAAFAVRSIARAGSVAGEVGVEGEGEGAAPRGSALLLNGHRVHAASTSETSV